jgi:glycosyltransferase involved in cell wall biosynthesis
MKTLLIIPSILKKGTEQLVEQDQHPTMDYYALAAELRTRGASVEFLDNSAVSNSKLPNDLALAVTAAQLASNYDSIFANSESVSIPLALILRFRTRRPRLVTIAHKLTSGKKGPFFRQLRVHNEIDKMFVYAETQRAFGVHALHIPEQKIRLISFHADTDFFRPMPAIHVLTNQFCSAGLEWRDYPTLVEVARKMPDYTFKVAAASPWSKHPNELHGYDLPPNVSAKRYEYSELRKLYAESLATVVPLYENDFQAGVTTILESMATGRPIVATRTAGQKDVIVEGITGFYVPPGDVESLVAALTRLATNKSSASKIGSAARHWIEQNASLKKWSATIAEEILAV